MEKTVVCSSCDLPFEVVGSEPATEALELIAIRCCECNSVNYVEWPVGCHYWVRGAD